MKQEVAVFVTKNGLGRAAIVRRSNGLLSIYRHWIWSEEDREAFNAIGDARTSWFRDETPLDLLYDGVEPELGVFNSVEDAIREIRSFPEFDEMVRLR